MMTVAHLESFLTRYRAFVSDRQAQKVASFKARFDDVLSGYKKVKASIEERELTEASRYNIFQILRVQRLEAKMHSPFLANLLNPKGSHGQKEIFLKLFIEQFVFPLNGYFDLRPENYKYCHVRTEHHTGDGFIDILIQSFDRQRPFQIVIENKVYANDLSLQMTRYRNYLDAFRDGSKSDSKVLIYLSPFGGDPKNHSISDADLKELKGAKRFLALSYKTHILAWLEDCTDKCQAISVKHDLFQYIQILKNL